MGSDQNRRSAGHRAECTCGCAEYRAEFGAAIEDFLKQQAQGASLDSTTLVSLGLRLASSRVEDRADPCGAPTTFTLGHIGTDSTNSRAVVVAAVGRGRGPMPGCGYAMGGTFLLRRMESGEWVVVGMWGGWRT